MDELLDGYIQINGSTTRGDVKTLTLSLKKVFGEVQFWAAYPGDPAEHVININRNQAGAIAKYLIDFILKV
jgi:hypothetical protein